MEAVAAHVNQMQQICEDFGAVFEQLAAEQTGPHRQVQSHGPTWAPGPS